MLGCLLEDRQERARLVVADGAAFLEPGVRPEPQRPVVDVAAASEDASQLVGLGLGRVEAEAVANLHDVSIPSVRQLNKERRFLPRLKAGVSAPKMSTALDCKGGSTGAREHERYGSTGAR